MYLFTSETVSAGHPDKCADIIADTIVDTLLQSDPKSKVATETFLSGNHIIIGGEVKTTAATSEAFYKDIARKALHNIGYPEREGFGRGDTLYPDEADIHVYISEQSPDITIGVEKADEEIGAGDQGIMFGYATSERDDYMPTALAYAREIRDVLYAYALQHPETFGVDLKTQVTIDYGSKENFDNCNPIRVAQIVVAISHSEKTTQKEVQQLVKKLIIENVKFKEGHFDEEHVVFYINNTGRFVRHSPIADSGLTGRKVVCDTYGGYAPIGGGSQSSKDYSKVDRSALYAARWVAKHIVAAGLAKKALVQLAYVIAEPIPISVTVDTQHTALTDIKDEELSIKIAAQFPLTPKWITEKFGLDRPSKEHFLYAEVAAKGQVGYSEYPWEQLDALDWFKKLKQ
ncbi:methionine adenosyltransferase [Sulfurovum sp. zt1-1]|uniref:Methionine adenosyltransferase n=1 Tax=Sulfurovum zhangzhouensis TaxID=3019067 RepID=A0ABT7QUX1_9BACT|nr:methionine adenosyltransferase [Sulfurovum zhangzhouensis]MDM5270642.1 methionine adenosyltransferase [Sulfurovum zhangzhouensis]